MLPLYIHIYYKYMNIMESCKIKFHEERMMEKMDSKTYLLGFDKYFFQFLSLIRTSILIIKIFMRCQFPTNFCHATAIIQLFYSIRAWPRGGRDEIFFSLIFFSTRFRRFQALFVKKHFDQNFDPLEPIFYF